MSKFFWLNDRERFLLQVVVQPSGCYEWVGKLDADGYGCFSVNSRRKLAHVFAHEEFVGAVPKGMCVLHTCDNRKCANPAHLWIGTRGANNKDRAVKGRSANSQGENHSGVKLTTVDVLAIRSDLRKHKDIAAAYGVSAANISRIKTRTSWTHI